MYSHILNVYLTAYILHLIKKVQTPTHSKSNEHLHGLKSLISSLKSRFLVENYTKSGVDYNRIIANIQVVSVNSLFDKQSRIVDNIAQM